MITPDYLICVECETPCYNFEWKEGRATEALCEACGNEEPDQFVTEDEWEALTSAPRDY